MAAQRRKPFHEQPKLCEHILNGVSKSDVPLRIGLSPIAKAGSGLFAVNNIPAGTEIFHTSPLIMVAEPAHTGVCDFCFVNSHTSVGPDGRFYGSAQEAVRPQITRCGACKVARYCSKTCQVKAWKSYHKYECVILQQNPDLKSLALALCRLLFWIKKKVISEDYMRVVMALETEFEARMERRRQDSDGTPEMDHSLEIAQNAHAAIKPGISLSMCRQLYCAIETNALAIRPPEIEDGYGTCLDLVMSLINHSCDENAHVFFEGRELKCRALKGIAAGEEITVCYLDGRQDVLHRRRQLKENFYFICHCSKCKSEMAEHVAAAIKRPDHLNTLRNAQDDLNQLEYKYSLSFYGSVRNIQNIMDYQTKLLDIEEKVYQGGNWPDHIEPMPSALRALGCMYMELKYVVGLEFVLKGTFYSRVHDGPRWVLDLLGLVKFLMFIAQEHEEALNWTGSAPPEVLGGRTTLHDTARGYSILACICGKFTFGVGTKYVQALYHWAENVVDRPGDMNVESEAFRERFKQSQDRLLTWAKMKTSRGLELPSKETIAEFRRDIVDINAGGQRIEDDN